MVAVSVPGVLAVSWTPPTNPAGAVPTDYRVRWAAVGDPFLTWSDLSGNAFPNAVSLNIGDLTVGTAYRVQVRARYRSGQFESAAWSGPWAESDPATVTDTYTPSVVLEGSMGVAASRHGGSAMYGYAKWGSRTGTGTFDAPGVKALVRLDGTHTLLGRTGLVDPVVFGYQTPLGAPFIINADGRLFPSTQAVVQETHTPSGAYWWIWDNQCAHWNPGDTVTVRVETLNHEDPRLEPADTTLNTLTINGAALNETFDPATADYTAAADADTETVTIEATAADTNACTVDISPADADADTDGHQINLTAPTEDETSTTTDVTVTVTAAGGATRSYQIAINRPAALSDDATLATLAITDTADAVVLLTPDFDASTTVYTAQAAADIDQVTITATPADADATTHIAPTDADTDADGHQIDVAEGTPTVVTVTVTAADTTTTQTYSVAVTRDPQAPAAAASAGLDIAPRWSFDPATKRYQLTQRRGTTTGSLTMTPASGSVLEAFTVDASLNTRQIGANGLARLSATSDTILFIRASGDQRESLYTVRLRPPATANQRAAPNNKGGGWTTITTRNNHEPTLSGLTVSPGTLEPAFAAATRTYTVDVAHDVEHLTVTPATTGTAHAQVRRTDVDPDTPGHQVALAAAHTGGDPAETTIAVLVVDYPRLSSYTITARRSAPPEDDSRLSALALTGVDFGTFEADRTYYQAVTAADLATTTLTWTATGTNATVSVSPDDADTNTDGHQISLPAGGHVQVTLTVESSDQTARRTYTVAVSRPSTAPFGFYHRGRFGIPKALTGLRPSGLWSDGQSMWIGSYWHFRCGHTGKIRVFNMETSAREPGRDISTSCRVQGLWSDGEILYASAHTRYFTAYDLQTKAERPELKVWIIYAPVRRYSQGLWSDGEKFWSIYEGREVGNCPDYWTICLVAHYRGRPFYNVHPHSEVPLSETEVPNDSRGLWSDGHTMWVGHRTNKKLYAYDMATGKRDASLDFGTLAAAGVGEPSGMWSDGRTMFVADAAGGTIYEFNMPALPVLYSLELSGIDIGHFRLSKYGYTAEVANTVTSTTVTAEAAASSSTVAILPADSDTNSEGHQVALSVGDNEITVTVTEGTDTRTYTVTITRASS